MSDISTITIFMVLYAAFFFVIFRKLKGVEERRVVVTLLAAACILRIALALTYGVMCNNKGTPDIIGDGASSTAYGIYIAEAMTGKEIYKFPAVLTMWEAFKGHIPRLGIYDSYLVSVLAYLQGAVYSILGYSVFFMKFLNSLFAIIMAFLIYYFLRNRTGPVSAILAMALVLFFPSMLIWSITSLKDLFVIFTTFVIILLLTRLVEHRVRPSQAVLTAIFAIILTALVNTTRERLVYLYVATFFLSVGILWFNKAKPLKKLLVAAALFIAVIAVFEIPAPNHYLKNSITWMVRYQRGQSNTQGKTFYRIYPERFYGDTDPAIVMDAEPLSLPELAYAVAKGVSYFGFAPFLSQISRSPMLLLVYPQSLLMLLLLPLVVAGIIRALKMASGSFVPMTIFLVIYWVTAAMASGNIGTAFRHRDVIMPTYLLFAAIGICSFFGLEKFYGKNYK